MSKYIAVGCMMYSCAMVMLAVGLIIWIMKSIDSLNILVIFATYYKKKITRWLEDMNFIFSC